MWSPNSPIVAICMKELLSRRVELSNAPRRSGGREPTYAVDQTIYDIVALCRPCMTSDQLLAWSISFFTIQCGAGVFALNTVRLVMEHAVRAARISGLCAIFQFKKPEDDDWIHLFHICHGSKTVAAGPLYEAFVLSVPFHSSPHKLMALMKQAFPFINIGSGARSQAQEEVWNALRTMLIAS